MNLNDSIYIDIKWRVDYIEKRLTKIDKEKDKESTYYYAETSAIYRVLLEDLVKDCKQIIKQTLNKQT